METKQFKITIDAPREKVWETLWNDKTYTEWTEPFYAGSRAETDWKKGSKVLFLSPENDGMIAEIEENIPNEFMSIKHIGTVNHGVEDTTGQEAKEWAGSLENYRLKTVNGKTEVIVDMDMVEKHSDEMTNAWPKALQRLKEISERSN